MHSKGKGIARSALPYKRSPPSWLRVTAAQVEEHVSKLAKKGLTPSQVTFLRLFAAFGAALNEFFCVCFLPAVADRLV
jgi:hypothetical protein